VTDPLSELVDRLDAEGNVVGTVTRERMRRENLRHRSVGIVVLDGAGRVLIHRRAEDKDVWPGRWDLAAGGVVAAGESFDEAARRELAEELGISDVELVHLGDGVYADESVDAVVRMYHVIWDGPVSFADGEVVEALWVSGDELQIRLGRDSFVPDSVAMAAEQVRRLLG
jgi:isopentenyldiphosphate isomerase